MTEKMYLIEAEYQAEMTDPIPFWYTYINWKYFFHHYRESESFNFFYIHI